MLVVCLFMRREHVLCQQVASSADCNFLLIRRPISPHSSPKSPVRRNAITKKRSHASSKVKSTHCRRQTLDVSCGSLGALCIIAVGTQLNSFINIFISSSSSTKVNKLCRRRKSNPTAATGCSRRRIVGRSSTSRPSCTWIKSPGAAPGRCQSQRSRMPPPTPRMARLKARHTPPRTSTRAILARRQRWSSGGLRRCSRGHTRTPSWCCTGARLSTRSTLTGRCVWLF